MKIKGWDLSFFEHGEWQVIDEHLKDLEKLHRPISDGYCPGRKNLFKALRLIPCGEVRVAILGQDPYPNPKHATGVAFSIPPDVDPSGWPPTLRTFLEEYQRDLHYPEPRSGSLEGWCSRGVLLWNVVPSCGVSQSLSHDWVEYALLTREIIKKLSEKGIVFALLGQVAQRYADDIDLNNNYVIKTSHPSPRGSRVSKSPFIGSRLFSTINAKLNENGLEPIDWKLP